MKMSYSIFVFLSVCFCVQAGQDPSEFLRTKWSYRFISLDVNHDGVLSLDDAWASRYSNHTGYPAAACTDGDREIQMTVSRDVSVNKHLFTGYHGITDTGNEFIDLRMESQWDACVGKQRPFNITMVDFIAEYAASIYNNPIGFEVLQRDCFYATANIADVNGDVQISESEFVGWIRAYGINNGDLDKALYALFEPHDDRVTISRIVDELVQFVCDKENIFLAVLNGA